MYVYHKDVEPKRRSPEISKWDCGYGLVLCLVNVRRLRVLIIFWLLFIIIDLFKDVGIAAIWLLCFDINYTYW